jgi:hypothetical protein
LQLWLEVAMKVITNLASVTVVTAIVSVIAVSSSVADASRSVALVLDASGSMNAKLSDGQPRLAAAKAAVADLVDKMDGSTRLALRAYGHQSKREDHNCKDTALLVGFGSISTNKGAVVAEVHAIEARGYTPITYALTLAAEDIANEEAGERVIVLVSDGQETCAADPCAAAKAIAAADAKLAIHTIGFGVGPAARMQLQCVANVARGSYFDASNADDLNVVLGKAAAAPVAEKTETKIAIKKLLPSRLMIKGTDAGQSHAVTTPEDGVQVADINGAHGGEGAVQDLPPGIYNVAFANGLWRGVEVKSGETTVLELGTLQIEGGQNDLGGYALLDSETGEVLRGPKVFRDVALIPGPVTVSNGLVEWPTIEIKAGEVVHLNPARFSVSGSNAGEYQVTTSDGHSAGTVSRLIGLPVPPGHYVVEVEGQKMTVELKEGQTHNIEVE